MSTYYEKNKEKCKAQAKQYYKEHREQCLTYYRDYYERVLRKRRGAMRKVPPPPPVPKPPKPEPRIKTVKKYLEPKQVFPDLSTIKDFTPVSSGLVEKKPGIVLDWNNL
jgi:hypothetical protein